MGVYSFIGSPMVRVVDTVGREVPSERVSVLNAIALGVDRGGGWASKKRRPNFPREPKPESPAPDASVECASFLLGCDASCKAAGKLGIDKSVYCDSTTGEHPPCKCKTGDGTALIQQSY